MTFDGVPSSHASKWSIEKDPMAAKWAVKMIEGKIAIACHFKWLQAGTEKCRKRCRSRSVEKFPASMGARTKGKRAEEDTAWTVWEAAASLHYKNGVIPGFVIDSSQKPELVDQIIAFVELDFLEFWMNIIQELIFLVSQSIFLDGRDLIWSIFRVQKQECELNAVRTTEICLLSS